MKADVKMRCRRHWTWTVGERVRIDVFSRADYYAFERISHSPSNLSEAGPWDFLLSAYDGTTRVSTPFRDVQAAHKQWVVHEEYGLLKADRPPQAVDLTASFDPPDMLEFVRERAHELRGVKVCIDSTGFIRPHLLVLLWALQNVGIRSFDVLYTDPVRYIADENTTFTGPVATVEQVPGYEGVHLLPLAASDLLVIGAGYDYGQIARACDAKLSSKKYILTGLPSLQPHMYQESVLQIERADESIGGLPEQRRLYASANHPFTVAQALHDLVEREEREAEAQGGSLGNLYLCPVGPKPHVLGFAIYYLRELKGKSASIIYPFARRYERLTTQGLLRTWQYRVEL